MCPPRATESSTKPGRPNPQLAIGYVQEGATQVGYVISGRQMVKMDDGTEIEIRA